MLKNYCDEWNMEYEEYNNINLTNIENKIEYIIRKKFYFFE